MPEDWFSKNAPKKDGGDWFSQNAPSAAAPAQEAPAASAPNFAAPANNTEGLYEMQGPSGTLKVPYSKVADAMKSGYRMNSTVVSQYAKDARAQHEKEHPEAAFHPLDALAAWGQKEFPHLAPEQMEKEEKSGFGTGISSVDRYLANTVTGLGQKLTAAPAAIYDAVAHSAWTPAESARQMQERAQGGTPVTGTPPEPTMADVSDYLADKTSTLASGAIIGEGIGLGLKGGAKVLKSVGPGTRVVADLVEKTRAENEASAAAAKKANAAATERTIAERGGVDEANAKQAAADKESRLKVLRENKEASVAHAAQKEQVEAANREAIRQQEKIAPTKEKLQSASEELRAREETAREKALKIGNEKYSGVREELNNEEADMEHVGNAWAEAAHGLGEVGEPPPLMRKLGKHLEQGEPLTYKDEQILYSDLGKELSKGSLPGSTYHAYELMHEAIGSDMQRIADGKGMGAELLDARNYWRRMKQTFGKPLAMTDNATAAVRGANSSFMTDDAQANRIRLLGSFDPEIPKVAQHIENLRAGVDALPKEKPVRDVVKVPPAAPEAKPIPKPTPPKPYGEPYGSTLRVEKKLGVDEIQGAKTEALKKTSDTIRNKGGGVATTFAIMDMIRNTMHGNMAGLGEDFVARGAFEVGKRGLANLLEKPAVVEYLTKATAKDVAAIPPEMRGDFAGIVDAAKAKGIKVSPALIGIAVTPKGPKQKSLEDLRGELQGARQ